MWQAYNVTLNYNDFKQLAVETAATTDRSLVEINESFKDLTNHLVTSGHIDAESLSKAWFPSSNPPYIFLSHSHGDVDQAKTFANWLFDKFGLTTFIDSEVWRYAGNLLKEIDNKYCMQESGYYSYDKRNKSTAHVHMMLAMALLKMMNKCECLFFLNTPHSTLVDKSNNNKLYTESTWIQFELLASTLLERTEPLRLSTVVDSALVSNESIDLKVRYDLDLSQMQELDISQMKNWAINVQYSKSPAEALDYLYRKYPENGSGFTKGDGR